jgi:hypothetical protein
MNKDEIRLTSNAGFEKTDITHLGLYCPYCYFPEDGFYKLLKFNQNQYTAF